MKILIVSIAVFTIMFTYEWCKANSRASREEEKREDKENGFMR